MVLPIAMYAINALRYVINLPSIIKGDVRALVAPETLIEQRFYALLRLLIIALFIYYVIYKFIIQMIIVGGYKKITGLFGKEGFTGYSKIPYGHNREFGSNSRGLNTNRFLTASSRGINTLRSAKARSGFKGTDRFSSIRTYGTTQEHLRAALLDEPINARSPYGSAQIKSKEGMRGSGMSRKGIEASLADPTVLGHAKGRITSMIDNRPGATTANIEGVANFFPLDILNPKGVKLAGSQRKSLEGYDELDITGTDYRPKYNQDGILVTPKTMVGIQNASTDKFVTEPAFIRRDSKGVRGMMGGRTYCNSRRQRNINDKEYPYGCPPKHSAAGRPIPAASSLNVGSAPANGASLGTPATFRT